MRCVNASTRSGSSLLVACTQQLRNQGWSATPHGRVRNQDETRNSGKPAASSAKARGKWRRGAKLEPSDR